MRTHITEPCSSLNAQAQKRINQKRVRWIQTLFDRLLFCTIWSKNKGKDYVIMGNAAKCYVIKTSSKHYKIVSFLRTPTLYKSHTINTDLCSVKMPLDKKIEISSHESFKHGNVCQTKFSNSIFSLIGRRGPGGFKWTEATMLPSQILFLLGYGEQFYFPG